MKPTIKNVAERAGVSFKTVSRVINNEPSVAEALRDKVWQAIKELDYKPNASARQLRGTSSLIGFVYDNPNSHYLIAMQHGILRECRRQGYELVIHPSDATAENLAEELIATCDRGQLAGLVLTPPISESDAIISALDAKDIRYVRIISGSSAPLDSGNSVYIDDQRAAESITEYLISLGHERIAFLEGDLVHRSSIEREMGFRSAMKAQGISIDESLILAGSYSFESGIERTKTLLAQKNPPSAVFACNDEIAAGTLFAARLMGIEVPKQLSIAGFEDSPFSRQTWPKLTTARQPTDEIAAKATALLIDSARTTRNAKDKKVSHNIGFLPQLVKRDSTDSPSQ